MPQTPTYIRLLRRFGPLVFIALGLMGFYGLGLDDYLGTRGFAKNFDTIMAWRAEHPLLSALVFVGVYVGIVAISVPASLWMSLPGGLLFGWVLGGVLSWVSAILGATLAFLAARTALDPSKTAKRESQYARFKAGFERNAFSYIIILRLMPLPFFAVNMAAGAFHVNVRTFAAASAIGLIPSSFLFAALGQTAGDILQDGGSLDMRFFTQPKIPAVFAGFASLALLPFVIRYFRKDKNR